MKCVELVISNSVISWQHELKYLGVVFNSACYLKLNVHKNKVKFFQSFNSIYSKLGSSNCKDTIVHLMRTNCLSVLMYGLESVELTKSNVNSLEYPLTRSFIKMFHVNEKNTISWCQYYMNQLPVKFLIDIRKRRYFEKLSKTDCMLLQYLYINSAFRSLDDINAKYNIDKKDSDNVFLYNVWNVFKSEIIV